MYRMNGLKNMYMLGSWGDSSFMLLDLTDVMKYTSTGAKPVCTTTTLRNSNTNKPLHQRKRRRQCAF